MPNLIVLFGLFSSFFPFESVAFEFGFQSRGISCQGLVADVSRSRTLTNDDYNQVFGERSIASVYSYAAKTEQMIVTATKDTCGISRQRLQYQIKDVPIYGAEAIVTSEHCQDEEGVITTSVTRIRGREFDSINVPQGYEPTHIEEKLSGHVSNIFGSTASITGKVQTKVFVTEKGDYLAYFATILRNPETGIEAYDVIIDAHTLNVLSICNLVESLEDRDDDRRNKLRNRREKEVHVLGSGADDSSHRNLDDWVCPTGCGFQSGTPVWSSTGTCPINTLYLDDSSRTVPCREGTLSGEAVDGPYENPTVYWNGVCDCDDGSADYASCDCDAPFRDCADSGYDVHFGGEKTMEFLQDKLGLEGGIAVSSGDLQWGGGYVHIGSGYCNAFCCVEPNEDPGITYVSFGECSCPTGPLTSLDVVAHELMHGVTRYTSNLQYSLQSGGLNEAYSDILGAAVEYEINDSEDEPDFTLGEEFNCIIRNMEFPFGSSIGHVCDYYDGLDVHYSSGPPNRAYVVSVRACEANGCGTERTCAIDMGLVYLYANVHGLTSLDGYIQAAEETCELVDEVIAALSLTITCTESEIRQFVIDGWEDVGVIITTDCAVSIEGDCLGAPPSNDDCNDAETLTIDVATEGTTRGATRDGELCGTSNTAPDVWYTITGTGGELEANLCSNTAYDSKLSVFSGSCGSLTCIGGNDDSCSLQSRVTWSSDSGVDYLILVHGYGSNDGDFEIIVQETDEETESPQPTKPPDGANDLCDDATALTIDVLRSGDTTEASFDDAGTCGTTNTAPGVWFSVIGTGNELVAGTCFSADFDTKISVFSGTCDSLVCEAGNDDDCSLLRSSVSWESTNGEEYLILVHGFGSSVGQFEILVEEIIDDVPANDECDGAYSIALNTAYFDATTFATYDGFETCFVGTEAPGVWFQVTGNGNSLVATTCFSGTNYDTQIAVYSGTCNSLTCVAGNDDSAACGSLKSDAEWSSTSGEDYFIVVFGYNNAVGDFLLEVYDSGDSTPTSAPNSVSSGSPMRLDVDRLFSEFFSRWYE